jgi:ABC-type Fe3+/spermidine/putrescine transport system ATPase subunit
VTTIAIDNVVRTFGSVRAVDGISLDVRDGEFFTLLGPSGCGKTTLLRMVAGFNPLDGGEIRFGGERIDTLPAHRRNTGMVFQNYAVFPNMRVGDNVAYGLRARNVAKAEIARRVETALHMVQLGGYGARWPYQLSGGQLQRVAIARAIVIEPHVLLLDEPLSNLDAKLRVEMRSEIRRLQRALGITVLYVTHDQEEALSMSDRIAVMRSGRVEQVAAPKTIYERPATAFVAGFVGTTNLLHARLVARAGAEVEVALGDARIKAEGASVAATAAGQGVLLSVRPEALRLLAAGEAPPPGWPVLAGTLGEVEYLGALTRFQVTVPEGPPLHLMALVPPQAAAREGAQGEATVRVALDFARVVVLPEER